MKYEQLARQIRRRPFIPFEVSLENGERYVLSQPELFVVTESICFVSDGKSWALFEPDEVTSVRSVRKENGRRRGRHTA